nr:MAG TPA: hypothetical protein [Bacteriophage sp.]
MSCRDASKKTQKSIRREPNKRKNLYGENRSNAGGQLWQM